MKFKKRVIQYLEFIKNIKIILASKRQKLQIIKNVIVFILR